MKNSFVYSLGQLARILRAVCAVTMTVSIGAMAVSVFVQIILRGFFHTTWLPLEDLVVYGFAIIVFTGTALVFHTNSHLATPVILDSLPPRARKLVHGFVDLLCLVFLGLMLYQGTLFTFDGMSQFSPLLRIPVGLIFVSIPVSAFSSIVFMAHRLLSHSEPKDTEPNELVA